MPQLKILCSWTSCSKKENQNHYNLHGYEYMGLHQYSVVKIHLQSMRLGFDPWVRKIPWRSSPGERNGNPL